MNRIIINSENSEYRGFESIPNAILPPISTYCLPLGPRD